jgi:hypothetical protein
VTGNARATACSGRRLLWLPPPPSPPPPLPPPLPPSPPRTENGDKAKHCVLQMAALIDPHLKVRL